MKKNFIKGAAFAALALAGFTATAQEEGAESALQLSGSVDAYFRANLNANNESGEAPTTSFANGNGFALGMANIIASKQVGKVGFVADLVFGPRGAEATFGSGFSIETEDGDELTFQNTSNIVNQLYVTYAVSEGTTLTLGNFNTFLGYEVISPTGNFNYSTSYMFSYGPFSHTGIKADFALSDEFSLAAAFMNATDITESNTGIGKYTGGLQLGYAVDSGSAYLNFLYGPQSADGESLFQVDLTTGWDLTEAFYLGVNATYQSTKDSGFDEDGVADAGFYGVALYPQVALSESFSLGLRGEYFAEFGDQEIIGGVDDNGEASVFAATLTGSYTQGALTIKPELRLDSASEESFFVKAGEDDSKSLASFVLGAIYAF